MLTVSSAISQALLSNTRMWKIKAEIIRNDVGATPIDISDRIKNCSITFDWDRRSGSASLEIDNYDYALSPINRNSSMNQVAGVFNPLFDSNHIINIYYGIRVANGTYEYFKKFVGVLGDEIDADSTPSIVNLTARDKSKLMQDAYIFQSKTYGTGGALLGMTLENVLQDMINQFLPNSGIVVSCPVPSNQTVGRPDQAYTAKDTNLWDACQLLTDAFNHELKFMEDGTLLLKKVVRDLHNVTPVMTFEEKDLISDSISTSDSDVRNHIVLRVQGLNPIERQNQDSIDKYGRRYMEVNRSMANVISTQELAHQFVDDLIKELSYVTPDGSTEMPLYPIIQSGDVVCVENTLLGTNPTYNIFRVVRVQESFSEGRKRTSLQLKGYVRFDLADVAAPKPVTGLTYVMQTRVIQNYVGSGWSGSQKTISFPRLQWTPPTQDVNNQAITTDFGGYTIYRKHSTQTNYVPVASISSKIASIGAINYFYDYTALVGLNSYKIVAVNSFGKVSAESSVLTFAIPIVLLT